MPIFLFLKIVKCQSQNVRHKQKDLTCITRNIHVKYQSSSTHCLNVISKVKVSVRMTERRNDRMPDICKYRYQELPVLGVGEKR